MRASVGAQRLQRTWYSSSSGCSPSPSPSRTRSTHSLLGRAGRGAATGDGLAWRQSFRALTPLSDCRWEHALPGGPVSSSKSSAADLHQL